MEEWAMNCSALQYTADPLECLRRHCENPMAKYLRTPSQVIMRSVNKEFNFEFQNERTYLLCELQTTFQDQVLKCPIYGTEQESRDYVGGSSEDDGNGSLASDEELIFLSNAR